MKKTACIYCPTGIGTTDDHVPPRGFFENSIPNNANLITVPCCEDCRKKDSANDEFVRNILASLEDTEVVDYVAKHIMPRRDRALTRSPAQLQKLFGMAKLVDIKDTTGVVIRQDWALSLDQPSIGQFLERTGRALLFEELGRGYFEGSFDWRLNPPIPDEIYRFAAQRYPKRKILDVVAYFVSTEYKGVYWIVIQFYGAIEFLLRYEKKHSFNFEEQQYQK